MCSRVHRLLVVSLGLLAGCDASWRTDMWYQPSYRTEAAPRPEPEHAVRVDAPPPLFEREDADGWRSPSPADVASVRRGSILFHDRCICCHGPEGHGGGPVSKKFPPAPDLAYASVRARSDGFIYATITLGGKAMPPVGEGLTAGDRWDLVHFIRREVQKVATPPAGAQP